MDDGHFGRYTSHFDAFGAVFATLDATIFRDYVLLAGQRGRIVIPLQKQPSPWVKVTTFQRGKKSREVAINKGEHMPIIYASLLFLCKFWGWGSRSTMIF